METKINCSTCKYVDLDTITYSKFNPDYCCFICKKYGFTQWVDVNREDWEADKFNCADWEGLKE